jgi:anti-sigma factor RsiW
VRTWWLRPVTDEDLVAFADGRLARRDAERVAAHLRNHPDDADRVRAYVEQDARLRKLYDRVLDEPVPARLGRLMERPRAGVPRGLAAGLGLAALSLAALAALLGVFGPGSDALRSAGRSFFELGDERPLEEAVAPRISSFAAAVLAARAAEPEAAHGTLATPGADAKVARMPDAAAAPDLGSLGLRLASVAERREGAHSFTEYVYRDAQGARVALYEAEPEAQAWLAAREDVDALCAVNHAGTHLVEWILEGRRYVLVGDRSLAELTRLALHARAAHPLPLLAGQAGPAQAAPEAPAREASAASHLEPSPAPTREPVLVHSPAQEM